MRVMIILVSTTTTALVVACSSTSSTTNEKPEERPMTDAAVVDAASDASQPPNDSGGAPTCPITPGERAALHGVVKSGTSSTPLAGVTVCVDGRSDIPCVETASNGSYSYGCVPQGDALVRFSLSGYATTLWARFSLALDDNELGALLFTDAENSALFTPAGVSYPRAGHGLVALNDVTDIDGITMSSSSPGVDGPYYSKDGTSLDLAATGTVGAGIVFFIAPVGTIEIAIAKPGGGGTCGQRGGGWGGTKPSTIALPVQENAETDVFVKCQ